MLDALCGRERDARPKRATELAVKPNEDLGIEVGILHSQIKIASLIVRARVAVVISHASIPILRNDQVQARGHRLKDMGQAIVRVMEQPVHIRTAAQRIMVAHPAMMNKRNNHQQESDPDRQADRVDDLIIAAPSDHHHVGEQVIVGKANRRDLAGDRSDQSVPPIGLINPNEGHTSNEQTFDYRN